MLINYSHLVQPDKLKLKTIRILFPLHREGLTSYLSPIFGQYAIKNSEFINDFIVSFNSFTNNIFKDNLNIEAAEAGGALYNETLFIPIIVNIYKAGKYNIKVAAPSLGFLYSNMFKKRRRFYKYIFSKKRLTGLRNFKKLLQISTLKLLDSAIMVDGPNIILAPDPLLPLSDIIKQYQTARNALHQRY